MSHRGGLQQGRCVYYEVRASKEKNLMRVLVSACLIDENCKYNGKSNRNQEVIDFLKDKDVVTICPEMLAGLGAPRACAEIVNGVVMDDLGNNIDEVFRKGVERSLDQMKDQDIDLVVLQSRSPTCGVKMIYDGTFSGKLIPGMGLFAQALVEKGYQVVDAEDISYFD